MRKTMASAGRAAGKAGTAFCMLAALSACGMGSFLGDNSDANYADLSATQAQIAQGQPTSLPALATECPPIRALDGASSYRVYQNNRTSDPSALRYQGVLERYTRNCVVSNGLITVRMGAAGRIVTGPASREETVTVPLRFAVERDGVLVFSQLYDVAVDVSAQGTNEFAQTVENVQIPYIGGEEIRIWVGFDA